jgi:hypothetical protein
MGISEAEHRLRVLPSGKGRIISTENLSIYGRVLPLVRGAAEFSWFLELSFSGWRKAVPALSVFYPTPPSGFRPIT